MSEISHVLIGDLNSGNLVKVIGRGTMEFCSELFDKMVSKFMVSKSCRNYAVYFDLSECHYMDSSFIGVIVSLEKRLKKECEGGVVILNPTDKVKEILTTMGLFEILPIEEDTKVSNVSLSDEIEKKLNKDYKDIKILLESHQNLMEINSENRKKFGLVEEMLKKELERNRNG